MTARKKFSHRRKPDGMVDSICHECLSTVATEQQEDILHTRESSHICNPELVFRYHTLSRSDRGERKLHSNRI